MKMRHLLFLLIALCAGGLLPIQGAINAQLAKFLNHPMQVTFVSFLTGLIGIIFFLFIFRPGIPSISTLSSIPAINYTGGFYGIVFVTAIFILAPKIGIANTLISAVVGQLLVSVFLDHFGMLGLAKHPAGVVRIIGCVGLVISLYLIQKS